MYPAVLCWRTMGCLNLLGLWTRMSNIYKNKNTIQILRELCVCMLECFWFYEHRNVTLDFVSVVYTSTWLSCVGELELAWIFLAFEVQDADVVELKGMLLPSMSGCSASFCQGSTHPFALYFWQFPVAMDSLTTINLYSQGKMWVCVMRSVRLFGCLAGWLCGHLVVAKTTITQFHVRILCSCVIKLRLCVILNWIS